MFADNAISMRASVWLLFFVRQTVKKQEQTILLFINQFDGPANLDTTVVTVRFSSRIISNDPDETSKRAQSENYVLY